MLQDSCKVTPRLLEKVYGSLRKRQKGKSHIFTPSPPAFYLVPVLFKFLQISDDLLAYWLKVNGYSLPHQFLFHVVITMNKEVAHIRYLPPFQVAVSLAKLEGQHIGSLADNQVYGSNCRIKPLVMPVYKVGWLIRTCSIWSGNSSCSNQQSLLQTPLQDGCRSHRVPSPSCPSCRKGATPWPCRQETVRQ